MWIDTLLVIGILAGLVIAVVVFTLNANTPAQLGPIPFFSGIALFVGCATVLLVRHVVWR